MAPPRAARFLAAALAVAVLGLAAVVPAPALAAAGPAAQGWVRLMAPADAADGGVVLTPRQAAGLPPTVQEGLGPGSALRQGVDGIQFVCSASFLLRDPATAAYYLATAGHCLVRDAEDPEPITGRTHPEKANNRIDVCVAGCTNNGLGLGTYVSLTADGRYHPVAFAESGGAGQDFGLVEVPADLHDLLRPALPQWGGPTGTAAGTAGDLVAHYGHGTLLVPGVGAIVTRTPLDQGRLAVHAGGSGDSFQAVGHVTGGDSGSAASLAAADPTGLARGTQALGVITHAVQVVGAPLMTGTLLEHGLAMAEAGAGLRLELVPEGDPLPTVGTGPPPARPASLAIVAPAAGAVVRPVSGTVRVEGVASFGGADRNATRLEVAVDDPAYGFASRLPVSGNESWTATWHTAGAAPGQHVLRARLVDAADGTVLDEENRTVRLDQGGGSSGSPAPAAPGSKAATSTRPAARPPATLGPGTPEADDGGGRGTAVEVSVPAAPAMAAAAVALLAAALSRRRR